MCEDMLIALRAECLRDQVLPSNRVATIEIEGSFAQMDGRNVEDFGLIGSRMRVWKCANWANRGRFFQMAKYERFPVS